MNTDEDDEELNYMNEEEGEEEDELEGSDQDEADESKRLIKKLTAEIALKTSNRAFNTDSVAKKVISFVSVYSLLFIDTSRLRVQI